MRVHIRILLVLLTSILGGEVVYAQEAGEYRGEVVESATLSDPLFEIDTTLFRLPTSIGVDRYALATRYYRVQSSTQRRGVYYATFNKLFSPTQDSQQTLFEPENSNRVSLYSTDRNYRIGAAASYARSSGSGWSLRSGVNFQTGRDCFVEGLFRNRLVGDLTLNHRFSHDHFITLNIEVDYLMRGVQSNATQESFALTNNNLYNPAWGLYHGEVRNSRVNRELDPNLKAHYQRRLTSSTHLSLDITASFELDKRGTLGWYDATNPFPDYYRKMPSYLTDGVVSDFVSSIWRTNNTDYTQINWDKLEYQNQISADGDAHYVVEDRVSRHRDLGATLLLKSSLSQKLTLHYGFALRRNYSRNYKSMRDLLGADYLLDVDQFITDSYNASTQMQNNLQDPNRHIVEGDRFGYDYSLTSQSLDATLRSQYRSKHFDIDIEATIGDLTSWREGHYERERFAGSASLGSSSQLQFSPYTLKANIGYSLAPNHYAGLQAIASRQAPNQRNLFLNAEAANFLNEQIESEQINSLSFNYRYTSFRLDLYGELYALTSRKGGWVTPFYDDLTSTMCRAVISGVGYRSLGAEIVADVSFYPDWSLLTTLAFGSYEYDKNPYVTLYEDFDLGLIAEPMPSIMDGVNVGNAPQVSATSTISYFGFRSYILRLSGSYAAERYTAPSIIRRNARVLRFAELSGNVDEFLAQEQLGNIFDIEVSAMRYIWIKEHPLSIKLAIRNLLGDSDRVYYARESDRLTRHSIDDTLVGASPRVGSYQYSTPRSILLSASYTF